MTPNIYEDDSEVLFLGTYPPRECGIATFTKDLTGAIAKGNFPYMNPRIAAMNRNGINIYNYSRDVVHQISDTDMEDYIEVAKQVNENPRIKLICIQHEFGIFGGEYGNALLAFLEIVQKPVVVTFHSVLPNPDPQLRKVVRAIAEKVKAIIVMTKTGVDILRRDYDLVTDIHVVPHGIPTVQFEDQAVEKKNLGFENKVVLSSFGMVGPGKGFENVIEALPAVVEKHPNVVYLIIGETHPVVRKSDGEGYRNYLEELVKENGLEKHVKFYNKYLTLGEIIKFLKATDIYISPSENPNQITSGTLSYALGCGRAAISTPFLHAKDLFEHRKELLTKFNDIDDFSDRIAWLVGNSDVRKEIEKEMYFKTRVMTWPNVALAYNKVFRKYLGMSEHPELRKLPRINTSHLIKMTDTFGIIQFANQTEPDLSSGYTLDDNARALLVCTMHYEKFREFNQLHLIRTYLDYIKYVQTEDGRLYNYVDESKRVDYAHWSEDAQGRALWALGYLASSDVVPQDFKREAEDMFLKALTVETEIKSPRAAAFIISGLYYYNKSRKSDELVDNIVKYADHLKSIYRHNSHQGWRWFEPYLTYANSKLSEAMFYAYLATEDKSYLHIAQESLSFLISKTFSKSMFSPIGQRGWYMKGSKKALFDQQPIDAAYTVQTLLLAHKITGARRYKKLALNTFLWFLGKNSLNQVIYNERSGGCHDGVGESSINLNQGAESTLSYLIARLSLTDL